MIQYKLIGGIENGIHYTSFAEEDVENENAQGQNIKSKEGMVKSNGKEHTNELVRQ